MGKLTLAAGARLALDSSAIIYMFEGGETYRRKLSLFIDAVANGEATAEVSLLGFAEVLVKPIELGDSELVEHCRRLFLQTDALLTRPLPPSVMETAARIRAEYGFMLPDCIHLASAVEFGATDFLTNDAKLKRFERSVSGS